MQDIPEKHYDILVVDDTPQNLTILTRILKKQGYRVRPAINGHVALKAVHNAAPDLILLDIMMPDMNGYELCEQLKANPQTCDIPVIFVSAKTEVVDKVKGFEAGGVDYITKPFQTEDVLARVHTHLTIRTLQLRLQDENARFQGLAEAAFEGLLIHDQGIIMEVNRALETLTGYPHDELIGQHILTLLAPESREIVERYIARNDEGVCSHKVRGITKTEERLLLEMQGKSLIYQGHSLSVLALRDMTWREHLEQENITLKASLSTRDHFGKLIGQSPVMQKVYERITQAAASQETVIIYGETGTGKELAARTLFELSTHHTREFVTVNCGALPENLFESHFFGHRKGAFTGADQDAQGYFDQAQEGTLFLDEVGELPLLMQAKLLRVLQDGEYTPVGSTTRRKADVRIIAATNKELRKMVQEGKIREDFFHRLHVIALDMPPLRWHKEDIPLLIAHFLAQRTPEEESPLSTIPADVMQRLMEYNWPGNVRELFNELRRYFTTGELELADDTIPDDAQGPADLTVRAKGRTYTAIIEEVERWLLAKSLAQHQGNRVKTAEALDMPLRSLHRKIKKYQL
jgi:PAS domain S-box-containing protein